MRNMIRAGAMVMALAAAAPALAQDVTFTAGETHYTVPAPKGYCSTGPAIDAYMAGQRAVNPEKMPDALFAKCGAKVSDPYDFFAVMVVRAPRITLPAMQAELRRTLPEAMQRESLVGDTDRAGFEQNMGAAMERGVRVTAGVQPVGIDDFCGYVAGVVHYNVEGMQGVDVTLIGCITSIGERGVYVFHYVGGTDRKAAVATLPEVKRLAQAVRAREGK